MTPKPPVIETTVRFCALNPDGSTLIDVPLQLYVEAHSVYRPDSKVTFNTEFRLTPASKAKVEAIEALLKAFAIKDE